jgi:hypothetical protein
MPISTPIAASGHLPKRETRVPKHVKTAILAMIEDGCDFIAAARLVGLKPDSMRRWLGRAETLSYLREQRKRFRASVCAGNEYALAEIRDTAENSVARVNAVKVLEQIDENADPRHASNTIVPGVTLRIVNVVAPSAQRPTIDVTPRAAAPEPQPIETDADPIFRLP